MQALWVSDVNDYILGSNFNIKGIIEKNKGVYWGAEFESWISSAPCYTLEKKHATINWTIHYVDWEQLLFCFTPFEFWGKP